MGCSSSSSKVLSSHPNREDDYFHPSPRTRATEASNIPEQVGSRGQLIAARPDSHPTISKPDLDRSLSVAVPRDAWIHEDLSDPTPQTEGNARHPHTVLTSKSVSLPTREFSANPYPSIRSPSACADSCMDGAPGYITASTENEDSFEHKQRTHIPVRELIERQRTLSFAPSGVGDASFAQATFDETTGDPLNLSSVRSRQDMSSSRLSPHSAVRALNSRVPSASSAKSLRAQSPVISLSRRSRSRYDIRGTDISHLSEDHISPSLSMIGSSAFTAMTKLSVDILQQFNRVNLEQEEKDRKKGSKFIHIESWIDKFLRATNLGNVKKISVSELQKEWNDRGQSPSSEPRMSRDLDACPEKSVFVFELDPASVRLMRRTLRKLRHSKSMETPLTSPDTESPMSKLLSASALLVVDTSDQVPWDRHLTEHEAIALAEQWESISVRQPHNRSHHHLKS